MDKVMIYGDNNRKTYGVNAQEVLRCGKYIIDEEFTDIPDWQSIKFRTRIILIEYCGELYYYKKVNGEVIEFKKVGLSE